MLRWIARGLAVLLALATLLLLGGWLYVRFVVGAVVNTPVTVMLSEQLPALFSAPRAEAAALAGQLRLPPGFALSVFARNLPDARMLRTTRTGDLLLASPAKGAVWLLRADRDGDGASDGIRLLLRGLDGPNGLDFHDRFLYVAEQGRIGRIGFDHLRGEVVGKYEVLITGLPAGGNHWKKTIRFGPDGMLYVAIGSTCNVCIENDARRAAMLRYTPDGKRSEVVATGLRNSAGFDWRPSDGALFATDNGRDLLGDDFPPCELNRIVDGGFYGWPFVNGDNVPDPDMGAGRNAERARARAPEFGFEAHNAPIGILFPRRLGAGYADAALVALHGSWNRSKKDGYKVVSLHWGADGRVTARDFLNGFLSDDTVHGRPAELAEGPDGAIYVSDDFTGAVYRIARTAAGGTDGVRTDAGAPVEPAAALIAALAQPAASAAVVVSSGGKSEHETPAERVAAGERLFDGSGCRECHLLASEPLPTNGPAKVRLLDLAARYDTAKLDAFLARPTPPMPPVGDAAERSALAAFLLSAPP